jgi:acylphosphatase
MTADSVHAHVLVSGRVQGVGYRASAYQIAIQLGLKGWVRNLPDGRVEAVFEGEKTIVDRMIEWCHQGPSAAIVEDVAVTYASPEGFKQFEIRR